MLRTDQRWKREPERPDFVVAHFHFFMLVV
jgi:hypothetical protein